MLINQDVPSWGGIISEKSSEVVDLRWVFCIISMKPLPSPLARMRPTLVHFLAFLQVTVQPMDVKADWVLINGLVNLFNLPDLSMGNKMTGDIAEAIKPLIEYAKMWSASDGGANFFDDLAISSIVIHLSFSLRGEVFQPPTDPLDIDDLILASHQRGRQRWETQKSHENLLEM